MFKVVSKELLCPGMIRFGIESPRIAMKAEAGQFVIVRTNEESERIPLTIADCIGDTVFIIVQDVGFSTGELCAVEPGGTVSDFVGPLGKPTKIDGLKKVAVVAGGAGCAIAMPLARALDRQGTEVHSVIGFKDKDHIILEEEFLTISKKLTIMTNDGSLGTKGLVTEGLEELLKKNTYDEVFAIGPLPMMRGVCKVTRPLGIKTTVSMNSIMIDGTGMCGCCRLTVGGKTKFACVDGPDFDGFEVDFEEAIRRSHTYVSFEEEERTRGCNLLRRATENV